MQGVRVRARASEPRRDGGLSIAEDTLCSRWVQTFGESRQHHCDLLGEGFQMVQRSIVSSAERGAASLTAECLDPLRLTVLAIANESMDLSICNHEKEAGGESLRGLFHERMS